jgi:catechol 2,3-dioxygenase-like lactoylglutathione lyase family enzyme
VTAVVRDDDRFIPARQRDPGRWSLIGGGIVPGEDLLVDRSGADRRRPVVDREAWPPPAPSRWPIGYRDAVHRSSQAEADTDVMPAPLVLGVAHSGLTVTDLDDALTLWCDGLGFTLERTFALDAATTVGTTGVDGAVIRAATVALGDHRVELLQYSPFHTLDTAGSPATIGTVHIALTVSDLDRVLELCSSHGWRPVGKPHRMTGGARAGTRIIYLEGALGGFLELIAPPKLP